MAPKLAAMNLPPFARKPGRRLLLGLGAASLAMLAACSALNPNVVSVSRGDIERLVAREFPLERRVAELFDATVQAPQLSLLPERNRLGAVVDVQIRERLLRGQWQGKLTFDSQLRWEARDQTVRLAQVRVQDFAVDNAGPTRSTAERLGAALAERVLEDQVIYRLNPERAAQLQSRGVVPQAVTVTSSGVEITFAPAAK